MEGKLVKTQDFWILELPIEAAMALGNKDGDAIKLSIGEQGLMANSSSAYASDKDFYKAATAVFSDNSGILKELAKR